MARCIDVLGLQQAWNTKLGREFNVGICLKTETLTFGCPLHKLEDIV